MMSHVIYQHADVVVDRSNEHNHRVRATAPIAAGELLMLEHVVSSSHSEAYIMTCVDDDAVLRESLAPRHNAGNDDDDDISAITRLVKKCRNNMFMLGQHYKLGDAVSRFNHACAPNVVVHGLDLVTPNNDQLSIGVIVALSRLPIAAGAELFVCYCSASGHDDNEHWGFRCNCTVDRVAMAAQLQQDTNHYYALQRSVVLDYLRSYCAAQAESRRTMLSQICATCDVSRDAAVARIDEALELFVEALSPPPSPPDD